MVSAIKAMFGKKKDAKAEQPAENIQPVNQEQNNTNNNQQSNENISQNTAENILNATMEQPTDDKTSQNQENQRVDENNNINNIKADVSVNNQVENQQQTNNQEQNVPVDNIEEDDDLLNEENNKQNGENNNVIKKDKSFKVAEAGTGEIAGALNILEVLENKGLLTKDQIRTAEVQADKNGGSVIDALIQMNFITESVVHRIFEKESEIEEHKLNIVDMIPDMELIKKIPSDFALEHKVMPISSNGSIVKIASNNPYDIVLLDQLSRLFEGLEVEIVPYGEVELTRAVDKFYRGNVISNFADILNEMELNVDNAKSDKGTDENSPVVRFLNALIYEAIRENASDIHIEPDELFVRIRFRVDGILINKTIVHKNYWSSICVRLKVMSGMNIAESRKPQDGAITMTLQGREIDFRVSSIPTIYGENIVVRVLDKTQGLTNLDELGFNKNNLKLINLAIKKPEGIVVVTGPTGSGKTTTLYSILSLINSVEDNIMTLEEPVEYRLPMIRQSEINHKAGFDFATGLRSLLRQDPDIIFLGEIRDQETAEIAIRASITGHQVYSTLHTNNAISAITRLIDMGIPSYMLAGSLSAVIAQRLVRKLCPKCKQMIQMEDKMKIALGLDASKVYNIYNATGCNECGQTGYKGRIVISEVLFVDEKINEVIADNPTIKKITDVAKEQGFITIQQDAVFKLLKGTTSWDELTRCVDMTQYSKNM